MFVSGNKLYSLKSNFSEQVRLVTKVFFNHIVSQDFLQRKKLYAKMRGWNYVVHLEMRNLKANRASVTEEQRRERLRIRREKDRARRRTKKLQEEKKRSSVTEDHEKQRLATLKRLKRGLDRNLRLEKVVASKQLRLSVEIEEDRRVKLENDTATIRLRLAMETDEERKARRRRW